MKMHQTVIIHCLILPLSAIRKRLHVFLPSEKMEPVWIRVGRSLLFLSLLSCLFSFLRFHLGSLFSGSSLSFFNCLWTFKFGTNFFRSGSLCRGLTDLGLRVPCTGLVSRADLAPRTGLPPRTGFAPRDKSRWVWNQSYYIYSFAVSCLYRI